MPPGPDVPDPATVRDFLAHTIVVLREATGVAARVVETATAACADSIAIAIRVRGHLSGLTWTFPRALARDAARAMIGERDPAQAMCIAAAGELANILTGRGLVALEEHGVRVELEPPELVSEPGPGTVAHLVTPHGVVDVVFHRVRAAVA